MLTISSRSVWKNECFSIYETARRKKNVEDICIHRELSTCPFSLCRNVRSLKFLFFCSEIISKWSNLESYVTEFRQRLFEKQMRYRNLSCSLSSMCTLMGSRLGYTRYLMYYFTYITTLFLLINANVCKIFIFLWKFGESISEFLYKRLVHTCRP